MSSSTHDGAYVRTEMLAQQAPPANASGPIKWMRENLFSGVVNSFMTIVSVVIIYLAITNVFGWLFGGVWNAGSLSECRTVLAAFGTGEAACWAVIEDRWLQLMFGFYPSDLYWRPILAVILLFVALSPVLFSDLVPSKVLWFSALYPFLAVWLIWGGSFWMPILVVLGFVVGGLVFSLVSRVAIGGIAVALGVVAAALWWGPGTSLINSTLNQMIGEPRYEDRLASAERRLAELPAELAAAEAVRDELQAEQAALISERDAVAGPLLGLQAELRLEELRPELTELEAALAGLGGDASDESATIQREIAEVQAEIDETEARLEAAGAVADRSELGSLQDDLLDYQRQLAAVRDDLSENATEIARLTQDNTEARQELNLLQDVPELREQLPQLREAASDASSAVPRRLRNVTDVALLPEDVSDADRELVRANINAKEALTRAELSVETAYASLALTGLEPVQSRQIGGFLVAVIIGVSGIVLSFPLGMALALGRQSDLLIIKWSCVIFIETIRGVPLIVWLFTAQLLLNYFLPPGTNFDLLLRVVIMVTFFASAYIAEVIRGGLAALPRGQYEGADSLGLNYWQSMRLIVLPQALKISIPGIVNTFIGLFKDTTLVVFIGVFDTIGLINAIRADVAWNGIYWELFIFVAVCFFICCFSMSKYSQYLERKLRTDHR